MCSRARSDDKSFILHDDGWWAFGKKEGQERCISLPVEYCMLSLVVTEVIFFVNGICGMVVGSFCVLLFDLEKAKFISPNQP